MPEDGRVARFREEVDIIRSLWTQDKTSFDGRFYHLDNATMLPKPVQKPHLPLWMGVGHPNAVRRSAELADGWMGSGGSSIAEFAQSVPILKEALAKNGFRYPFPQYGIQQDVRAGMAVSYGEKKA